MVGQQLVGQLVVGELVVREQLVGQLVVRQQLVGGFVDRELVGHGRLELTTILHTVAGSRLGWLAAVSRGPARVGLFIVGIAAAAAVLFTTVVDHSLTPPAGFLGAAVVVALIFTATEAYPIHLHFRQHAHSFSLSDVALVLGLFTLTPSQQIGAHIAGGVVAVTLRRRQRLIKAAFNVSQFALNCTVAIVVFQ